MTHPPADPRKPLLLLDVDGVLVTFGDPGPLGSQQYEPLPDSEFGYYLPSNEGALAVLRAFFEPVWATSWEHTANEELADLFGLPQLPVIEFSTAPPAPVLLPPPPNDPDARPDYADTPKLSAIAAYAGDRALAWIDDEIREDDRLWARRRQAPTELVQTNPRVGFTYEHVRDLLAFADWELYSQRVWLDASFAARPEPGGWLRVSSFRALKALIDEKLVRELSLIDGGGRAARVIDYLVGIQEGAAAVRWPLGGLTLRIADPAAREPIAEKVRRHASRFLRVSESATPKGHLRFDFTPKTADDFEQDLEDL